MRLVRVLDEPPFSAAKRADVPQLFRFVLLIVKLLRSNIEGEDDYD